MKIKPLYIYLGVFVAFIAAFIIFSGPGEDSTQGSMTSNMPQDEIHKGMNSGGDGENPSSANVSTMIKQKMDSLRIAYEKNPKDTLKAREYADLLSWAHNPDKAMEIYDDILKVNPNRIDILLQLTLLNYNKSDFDKAEEISNRIMKIDSKNFLAEFNLGAIAEAKGQIEKAKSIWSGLIKKYPNSPISHIAEQSLSQLDKPKK